jgi:hypothetical protein
VGEEQDSSGEDRGLGERAPLSSPRAYFGRASRATSGPLGPAKDDADAAESGRPPVYRAGDPALRIFAKLHLPFPTTMPLTGAVATLSGVRDGAHEKLLIDLGTTRVRSALERDEAAGTVGLALSRTQSAETYRGLLGSLRYVNDAAPPTLGARHVAIAIADAAGDRHEIGATDLVVDAALPEPGPEPGPEPAHEEAHREAAETAEAALPPDERITDGDAMRFNVEGGYTLFWWPRLLHGAAPRARQAAEPEAAGEAGPAGIAGSYFSGGGRVYRLFGRQAPAEHRPPPPRSTAANDEDEQAPSPYREAWLPDGMWTPGSGDPPPGFERAPMLRLEDVFGSDMADALSRRLLEQRIASGR